MTPLSLETLAIPPVFDLRQPLSARSDPASAGQASFHDALTRARSASAPPPDPPDPRPEHRQRAGGADDRQAAEKTEPSRRETSAETETRGGDDDASADPVERTQPQAEGEPGHSKPVEESDDEKRAEPSEAAAPVIAEIPADPQPDPADGLPTEDASSLLSGETAPDPAASAHLPPIETPPEDAGASNRTQAEAEQGAATGASGEAVQEKPAQPIAGTDAQLPAAPEEISPSETSTPHRPGRNRQGHVHRNASEDSGEPAPAGQQPQSTADGLDEPSITQPQHGPSEPPVARQTEPPPASPQIATTPPENPGSERTAVAAGEADAAMSSQTATEAAARTSASPVGRDMPAQDQIDRVRFVQRVARAFESVGEHGGNLHLRLHPPELGSLRLEVAVRNGVMTARLEAETPAAQSLLLDNLPLLRERLAEQNIRIERFDVDLMDRSSGGSPGPSGGDTPSGDRHGRHQQPSRGGSEGPTEDAALRRGPLRSARPGRFDVTI